MPSLNPRSKPLLGNVRRVIIHRERRLGLHIEAIPCSRAVAEVAGGLVGVPGLQNQCRAQQSPGWVRFPSTSANFHSMETAKKNVNQERIGSLLRRRPWVQSAFLGVWLAPVGEYLHAIPGCVFHCYSCPLSSFACPIGVLANYAALFPAMFEVPYLALGVLLLVGALGGSVVCGWACPFGFLQDLLGKLSAKKVFLPNWVGHFRYVVLVAWCWPCR